MIEVNSFFKNRKVLETGHTGFIGSWFTKWLTLLSANVYGYSIEPPSQPNIYDVLNLHNVITDIRGDIRNKDLLLKTLTEIQPEIVIHLAAQPIVLESYEDPVKTFDINVIGTVNLLNIIRKVGCVKVIVIMTSDKTYQNNEWAYQYREIDNLGGKDPYSASKSCQDIVVNSFRDSFFLDSGTSISSVRSGNVIGGGDWAKHRIIPDIIRSIFNHQAVRIRSPNSIRPWQHVLEPISGIMTLIEKMWKNIRFSDSWNFGPAFNKDLTVRELTETFIRFYGKGFYEIVEGGSSKEANYLQLDISKAKRELNWFPRLDIYSALKLTADWYKNYYSELADVTQMTVNQINSYRRSDHND